MKKISNTGNVPLPSLWANGAVKGSRWCYYVDATGTLIEGGDQVNLLERVIQHHHSNNIPVPVNISEVIEDAICRHSETPCVETDNNRDESLRGHLKRVMRFGSCLARITAKRLMGGDPFVDQQEANRRASICAECPANKEAPTCPSCVNFIEDVNRSLGYRETPYDDQLQACDVCGCSNSASVWIDAKILKQCSDANYQEANPKCWKG